MRLRERPITVLFALTSFVSAALLFSVQPMIAKLLLPLLGGTPNVWNTCMLFFQAVLLAGYGYAVVVSTRAFKQQLAVQLLLLGVALVSLPIGLTEFWVNSVPRSGNPSLWLLACLAALVGLPFFIVSSNAPILQKWFAQTGLRSSHDPYFLYSASNAGSLLALISYPLLLEPNLRLRSQSLFWTAGYVLLLALIALCGLVAWTTRRKNDYVEQFDSFATTPSAEATSTIDQNPLSFTRRLRWLLLAFVPSSLMLGVTNFISTDIASVPLLWVIPLSLYLLTFILAFARRQPIRLSILVVLLPVATVLIVISNVLPALNVKLLILLNLVYFFIAALTCHMQLAEDRPSTAHLTQFYLWLSLGGALGGVFNALVAPIVFKSVVEYPIVVLVGCLLLPVKNRQPAPHARALDFAVPLGMLVLTLSIVLMFYLFDHTWKARMLLALVTAPVFLMRKRPVRLTFSLLAILVAAGVVTALSDNTVLAKRNFFGTLRVTNDPQEQIHWLFHGSTNHGRQSTKSERKCEPLSYYHRNGPLGEVFSAFQSSQAPKKVAIVGLGTGATAVYAQPKEQWTFYEINPAVVDIARNPQYFTYLTQCNSVPMDVVLGDARLRIRDASDANYGLIVLDAFSSDAIPLHLITQEAVDSYLSKLGPQGMLVFHISNRHLDLSTVMADLAASRGLYCLGLYDPSAYDIQGKDTSVWVVMARQSSDTGALPNSSFARALTSDGSRKVWTDDFSNIFSVLRWH